MGEKKGKKHRANEKTPPKLGFNPSSGIPLKRENENVRKVLTVGKKAIVRNKARRDEVLPKGKGKKDMLTISEQGKEAKVVADRVYV